MYRRLIVLSLLILGALTGLSWLGYHAIELQKQGLEGRRIGDFAAVSEQIRLDVMKQLKDFIETEKIRPYTDYQYHYVPPDNLLPRHAAPLRSPLSGLIENDLAKGYFQIDSNSKIITPYYAKDMRAADGEADADRRKPQGVQPSPQTVAGDKKAEIVTQARRLEQNVHDNLLPVLKRESKETKKLELDYNLLTSNSQDFRSRGQDKLDSAEKTRKPSPESREKSYRKNKQRNRRSSFNFELKQSAEQTQIFQQKRIVVTTNEKLSGTTVKQGDRTVDRLKPKKPSREDWAAVPAPVQKESSPQPNAFGSRARKRNQRKMEREKIPSVIDGRKAGIQATDQSERSLKSLPAEAMPGKPLKEDLVQILVEPFVAMVVPDSGKGNGIFEGQVFLLRHVQIEDNHLLQGFQLSEKKLLETIDRSARRFMREGMCYELGTTEEVPPSEEIAFTAVLDFEFGDIVLHLMEKDPLWIGRQIVKLQYWYFSIIAIVFLAVLLGLMSVWRNMREQVRLARQKDDFISAVSHELRTPLTSIRMYTEMLENNWVKTEQKRGEYYRNMRQESERLSRLIENVLDFSRIQRQKKKYHFQMGDLNECVKATIEKMEPYARQAGFTIQTELAEKAETTYDRDVLMQIVINLLDNAIKYAGQGEDKTIYVRTKKRDGYIIFEVEDTGPGIPHRQREKVFEEFYRCEDESTRETTGTGLGLALVKRFAEAHNGFVQILGNKPQGAIVRVGLIATGA